MKFLWGTTFGAAMVAWAVVAGGGRGAWFFGTGMVVGALISLWTALHATPQRANVPKSQSVTESREEPRQKSKRLKSRLVLSTVEQEVLSGLMNLGASFRDAEAAVRAAGDGHDGKAFDELFRLALTCLKAKNGHRAA